MSKTFGNVSVTFGTTTLTGYLMDDGSVQMYMQGKMQTFPSLMEACHHWLSIH